MGRSGYIAFDDSNYKQKQKEHAKPFEIVSDFDFEDEKVIEEWSKISEEAFKDE